jgi:carbon-monoxide dehydrogenase catalytic subunit
MTTEEVQKKVVAAKKKEKAAPKPEELTVDPATAQMIKRSREMDIDTIFDRAQTMKPCNIGAQGTCCKNCSQGPCRLPLPKSGIEGEDTRKGLCGATPNTIAARNFARHYCPSQCDDAFTAMLIADVALPVLLTNWTEYYQSVVQEWMTSGDRLSRIEKKHLHRS